MSTVGAPLANIVSRQDFTSGGGVNKQTGLTQTTQITQSAGRLMRVIVIATGTGTWAFYDANGSTKNQIGATPASPTVGQVFDFRVPVDVGIYAVATASAPTIVVTYN